MTKIWMFWFWVEIFLTPFSGLTVKSPCLRYKILVVVPRDTGLGGKLLDMSIAGMAFTNVLTPIFWPTPKLTTSTTKSSVQPKMVS